MRADLTRRVILALEASNRKDLAAHVKGMARELRIGRKRIASLEGGENPDGPERGGNKHDSRVRVSDFATRQRIEDTFTHPVLAIDWADEFDDAKRKDWEEQEKQDTVDRITAYVLAFLRGFMRIGQRQRDVIIWRATGMSLADIGQAMGGRTAQAAEKTLKEAIQRMPCLAFAFPEIRTNKQGA